ncbi:MAG: hypothetical protein AAGD06_24375 [Acidobacteriota bacterium]
MGFLGIDEDTGRPFFPPLPRGHFDGVVRKLKGKLLRYGVSPSRLDRAGWGVVLPRGVDPAVRSALAPLLELRRRQSGDLYRELTYHPRRSAGSFLSALRAGPGPVDPRRVPYYLLLVGGPEAIPHGFEMDLDVQHAVGRLAFEAPRDYAAYAEGLVAAETRRSEGPVRFDLLVPSHAGDEVTERCVEYLGRPLGRSVDERRPAHVGRRAFGAAATRDELLDALIRRGGDLVLTAGHALLARRTDPEHQRRRQGALIGSEWTGPGRRVPPEVTVAAADLPQDADLVGRVFVLFGCFTGGTPRRDSFDRMEIDGRRELAERPFVARLPQALLSHPAGAASAVVAHVDRAWPTSFEWRGAPNADTFEDLVLALLDGETVGTALEPFRQRFLDLASRLGVAALAPGDAGSFDRPDPVDLWRAYNDARSFVVLGDPAASLSHGRA